MTQEPKASSTPKLCGIKCRRGVRESNEDFLRSPISSEDYYNEQEKSDLDSNDESDDVNITNEEKNREFGNCVSPVCVVFIIIIFGLLIALYHNDIANGETILTKEIKLEDLQEKFPSQEEDFWLTIKVNVEEVLKSNHPKTFLFLYDEGSKETTNKIVYEISKYAVCILANCSTVPIKMEGRDLGTPEFLKDYGNIIAAVQERLKIKGVMVVTNLEDVPGRSAQAFHSLCDEHNPLVNKALFIFTMKVDKHNVSFVEEYLRNLWSDIKDDLFHPLFTRISYNILPIVAEN